MITYNGLKKAAVVGITTLAMMVGYSSCILNAYECQEPRDCAPVTAQTQCIYGTCVQPEGTLEGKVDQDGGQGDK